MTISLIFCIIFFFIIIFLIFYIVSISISKIDPQNCPQVYGLYGVSTNQNIRILKSCGTDKNSQCTFYNINSLNDAELMCNILPDICSSFTYSDTTKIMNIVDSTSTSGGEYNVYTRQYLETLN